MTRANRGMAALRESRNLVAGFVLVGGQSSRMGRDKAFLPSTSGPLVAEIAGSLAAVTENVALVGRPDLFRSLLHYDCLDDVCPGFGPLSGIHTALKSRRGEYNLILACDMPGADRTLLMSLLQCAAARAVRCVVPVDAAGKKHPLCAVYHSTALEAVEDAIRLSRPRLMDLLSDLDAFPFECEMTIPNCNTPAEWAAYQSAK
ncbi:MAG TPA: molybdenum cofactor guanylyltransferase [Bryobacteraceae bacterium]|nr:molybdenum cofactor guanylyltransferase [Bryobacteraceae bacterium]